MKLLYLQNFRQRSYFFIFLVFDGGDDVKSIQNMSESDMILIKSLIGKDVANKSYDPYHYIQEFWQLTAF